MEQIAVFLDSNVLFSIAFSGSKSRSYLLFELQNRGIVKIYISELVYLETSRNLQLKKQEQMNLLKELLKKVTRIQDIYIAYSEINYLPEADRTILSTAVYNGMDFFLTGNTKDFSKIYRKKIHKTMILEPKEFLYEGLGLIV